VQKSAASSWLKKRIGSLRKFWKLASAGLAVSTWKVYNSTVNLFELFCLKSGRTLAWPLDSGVVLPYIVWAATERGLAEDTIRAYLTAMHTMGAMVGCDRQTDCWDTAKSLLRGVGRIRTRMARRVDPIRFYGTSG